MAEALKEDGRDEEQPYIDEEFLGRLPAVHEALTTVGWDKTLRGTHNDIANWQGSYAEAERRSLDIQAVGLGLALNVVDRERLSILRRTLQAGNDLEEAKRKRMANI